MKLLAAAILCWISVPVFAQKGYIPDDVIDFEGEAGDYTVSNYYTKEVYARHLKVDDIVSVYNGLLGFRQGNKYGFMNFYGKVIRPAEFDAFDLEGNYPVEVRGEYLAVRKGDLTALIDSMGVYALPLGDYDYMWDSGKGTCAAEKGESFGLFRNGKSILPMVYQRNYDVFEFTHETMPVFKDGMAGLVNTSGKLVLPVEYSSISELEGSGWLITKDDLTGLTDYKGKIIVPCSFQTISRVHDGLVYGSKNGRYGVQKLNGTVVCPFEYDYLSDNPDQGVLFARQGDYWGILSMAHPEKTEFLYTNYSVPMWNKNHLAPLKKNGKVGLVNTKNEVVFDFILDDSYEEMNFQYGVALVSQNGLYGLMSESGKLLFPCEFDELNLYSSFPKIARKKGKYGVIDASGKTLVPFEYDDVNEFDYSKDLYMVTNGDKTGLYLAGEKLLIPVEYGYIGKNMGFFEVMRDNKVALYNEDGSVALPFEFNKILELSTSSALVSKDGILKRYDLVLGKEQNLEPDSIIRFETTTFLNFGKSFKHSARWTDQFAKSPETGVWYCVDKKTNALIGNPYFALGHFNEQGIAAVTYDYNTDIHAINSKGEEVKPHFYLTQGQVFETSILEDSQDSIIYQFQQHGLLQNVKPENYWNHIETNYVISTIPYDMYDDFGNATPAFYLSCYNKASYVTSETPFPSKPEYAYDFKSEFRKVGPPNKDGWRWAIPNDFKDDYIGTVNMDVRDVVLVNELGEVKSKPNYNPVPSEKLFGIISYQEISWDEQSLSYILDTIRAHFPGANSLSNEKFLSMYADSVYIESGDMLIYSEEGEYGKEYTYAYFDAKNLQLFDMPPPSEVKYRFTIKDIHQVKGGESLTQPDQTHRFFIDDKTAYSFGNKHYFIYPVLEGVDQSERSNRIAQLRTTTQNKKIAADLQKFDFYTQLIEKGMTSLEYPDDVDLTPLEDQFQWYSYTTSVGLAMENELLIQPKYINIAYDTDGGKFIMVDSLFHLFSFDPVKKKTTELKDVSYAAAFQNRLITRSEKTKLFDLYNLGATRPDAASPYEITEYIPKRIKNVKHFYFTENCQDFVPITMNGEDSVIIHEDGTVEYVYIHYCDTLSAGYYTPFSTSGYLGWYELSDGSLYNYNGEKETNVGFSDYVKSGRIPINESIFQNYIIEENAKGLLLKSEIDGRTLQLSDAEYRSIVSIAEGQNGFGGVFRKGKFIPYSTMIPFPEKHSIYIHLSGPFWLIGEENALELISLSSAENKITKRYPEKLLSYKDFLEKRDMMPEDSEVGPIELFMMME